MRRVLIITYYWPPGGGAGVQRWLKFAKYLPQYGWQPVIYTPENPEMPVVDVSLLKDIPKEAIIIKRKVWEPYTWYKRFTGRKGENINAGFLNEKGKGGRKEKIAVWLRGNLFIPDARKFWIRPSVRFLSEYLEKEPVDVVISSGPPHSMHMIASGLKKKMNVKWIADFRDPWTNIDYYHELMLSSRSDKLHHQMEYEVLTKADAVVAVGKTMAEEFRTISGRNVDVITNGFDDADLTKTVADAERKFTIAHIGTLVKSRNPVNFWSILREMIETDARFSDEIQILLIGKVDFTVRQSLVEMNLWKFVKLVEYVPHDEVIQYQQQAEVLLLILNDTPNAKGILTGKLFEYMAARRPVICIGDPEGDAAEIISETKCGITCNFDDVEGMKKTMAHYFNLYINNNLTIDSTGVERYSRKSLTAELVKLLNNLTE